MYDTVMLGIQLFILFITYFFDNEAIFVFMIIIVVLIYSPRVLGEILFILTKYNEFISRICFMIRVVTVIIDAVIRFIQTMVFAFTTEDEVDKGIALFFTLLFLLVFTGLDAYFTYVFRGYIIHVTLRYDRSYKGPNGEFVGLPGRAVAYQFANGENVQNAVAHDQEVPETLNHGENYQAEDQLAQIETHQIQGNPNNLASRSFKENDDKAAKDNDTNVAVQPMVDKDKQAEDPNIQNRRVDEEDL